MRTYEFILILREPAELTEDVAERLFLAGCDDGSPGMSEGCVFVHFHREANSLEEAIDSAAQNVRSAGYLVHHAELEVDNLAAAVV